MSRTEGLVRVAIVAYGFVHTVVRPTEIVETERTKRHRAILRWGWLAKGTSAVGRLLSRWWPS